MADPAWASSPPEANYLRLIGPGAGGTATTLASGAAWQALMGSNEMVFAVSTVNTAVTAVNFEGVGGAGSAAAVTGLNSALQLLSGWVQEKPPIAASAVAAYQTAVSAMIPAEICIANRTEQAADVAINPLVLGALTPAIVALDAAYFGEFWPHNASAGAAYGAALAALVAALSVPPPLSPLGGSPAGPAAAAAAATQAAGQAAAVQVMQQSTQGVMNGAAMPAGAAGQVSQAVATTAQPLQTALGAAYTPMGMFQASSQALQSLSDLPPSFTDPLPGLGEAGLALPVLGETGRAGAFAGPGSSSFSTGSAGSAAVGLPGAGVTAYARPPAAFAAENSGRPAALKTAGPAVEFHGPTAPGIGSAFPIPAGQPGVQSHTRNTSKEAGSQARIVTGPGKPV